VLETIVARSELVDTGAVVAPQGWEPTLAPQQRAAADAYLASLRSSPFQPSTDLRPADDVVAYLDESGQIVDCGSATVFAAEAFEEMTRRIVALAQEKDAFTMADARDLLGSSRRYVQPFLEELDRRRVTMRRGDERVLRG
jgi:selenocysteine-specific elongation factor